MTPYRVRQQQLPGIYRVPVPGEPIPDRPLVSTGHQTGVPSAAYLVSSGRQSGATGTPDSRAFDPSTTDPKATIHHGDAALNAMPAWLSFKEQLRAELSDEESDLWVRPMLLLKAMPIGADQKHLLAAIPANRRIQGAAMKRLPMMRELLAAGGLNISLTKYPDEWEVLEAKKRYGIDVAPKPWTRES